jgi:glycosyltransferase involved in cell wall biosynthesis
VTAPESGVKKRVAIVTQGLDIGGGVPSVARWLQAALIATGRFSADVHDLATSSRDSASRRIASPSSWFKRSLATRSEAIGVTHWGANAVELEPMRYRRRAELTRALKEYDVIQVVAGGPAIANAVVSAGPPVFLQVATLTGWERPSQWRQRLSVVQSWRICMTRIISSRETAALRGANAVLVENERMLKHVRSLGQTRVLKVHPGVDVARFTPRTRGWASDGYILSVCRLGDRRKGLDRVVEAYAQMAGSRDPTPRLVLAGRGEAPSELTRLISNLGVTELVDIRPNVSPDDLPTLYREASTYLQGSYEEGLGISVLEAMASGIPIVSTLTAGTAETVLHGQTGWLVAQGSSNTVTAALADRLRDVIDSGPSMASASRMRAVQEFSTQSSITAFTRLYEMSAVVAESPPDENEQHAPGSEKSVPDDD